MAPADEQDPVLIPSLPDPWEGLVREMILTTQDCDNALERGDVPDLVSATHAASRAEKALRVALLDLLRGGKTGS